MADVTFTKIKLKNVRFYNVDFQRLRLADLDLNNVVWDTLSIEQCYISGTNLDAPVASSNAQPLCLPLLGSSALS